MDKKTFGLYELDSEDGSIQPTTVVYYGTIEFLDAMAAKFKHAASNGANVTRYWILDSEGNTEFDSFLQYCACGSFLVEGICFDIKCVVRSN